MLAGCRLLLISLNLDIARFILGLASSIQIVSFITLKISKLRGLKVVAKANGCFSVLCSFGLRSSSKGTFFAC